MSLFVKALSFFSNPIADLSGSFRERKRISAESTARVVEAEIDLKISKLNAKSEQAKRQHVSDSDYDMQVLRNRGETIMDNVVIFVYLGLMIAHFIPFFQPYMLNGWKAMGYDGAPWFFEFVNIGIVVSTLGLMRLFKIFMSQFSPKKST